jgi:hypothetical protein
MARRRGPSDGGHLGGQVTNRSGRDALYNGSGYDVAMVMPLVASQDVRAHRVERVELSAGVELDDVPA